MMFCVKREDSARDKGCHGELHMTNFTCIHRLSRQSLMIGQILGHNTNYALTKHNAFPNRTTRFEWGFSRFRSEQMQPSDIWENSLQEASEVMEPFVWKIAIMEGPHLRVGIMVIRSYSIAVSSSFGVHCIGTATMLENPMIRFAPTLSI
jgi:hypothetical protein